MELLFIVVHNLPTYFSEHSSRLISKSFLIRFYLRNISFQVESST